MICSISLFELVNTTHNSRLYLLSNHPFPLVQHSFPKPYVDTSYVNPKVENHYNH